MATEPRSILSTPTDPGQLRIAYGLFGSLQIAAPRCSQCLVDGVLASFCETCVIGAMSSRSE